MELIAVQEYWKAFNDNKLLSNNRFTENQKNTSDICKLKNNKARKQIHEQAKSILRYPWQKRKMTRIAQKSSYIWETNFLTK